MLFLFIDNCEKKKLTARTRNDGYEGVPQLTQDYRQWLPIEQIKILRCIK